MRRRKAASGPKFRRFPDAPPRAKRWRSFSIIYTRRSKAAFRSTLQSRSRMKGSASWKFLYEDTAATSPAWWSDAAGDCSALAAAIIFTASPELSCVFSIPIHGNRPLKTGLLRHLAKLAEISAEELE